MIIKRKYPGAPEGLQSRDLDTTGMTFQYRGDDELWYDCPAPRIGHVIRIFRDGKRWVGDAGERQWFVMADCRLVPSLPMGE